MAERKHLRNLPVSWLDIYDMGTHERIPLKLAILFLSKITGDVEILSWLGIST